MSRLTIPVCKNNIKSVSQNGSNNNNDFSKRTIYQIVMFSGGICAIEEMKVIINRNMTISNYCRQESLNKRTLL